MREGKVVIAFYLSEKGNLEHFLKAQVLFKECWHMSQAGQGVGSVKELGFRRGESFGFCSSLNLLDILGQKTSPL
jgi:uncharacterized protein YfiM (DUF2279 family)